MSVAEEHAGAIRASASGREPWWKGAVIYQIYPRSFMDSNGDGIGDLPGITSKLDHVASLGADAIWVSPFFTSPMHDFGYDVAEFRNVDPIFGTLEDFDALVEKAHDFGLKVIIDQVYSHSSDQHRWFAESRTSRNNPKADWYVWADPKPDGTPPNNWQSLFSGPAWKWDPRRGQYYFHNFLPEQPDLNLHNAEVQAALLDVSRFWLDRGVDGFRIDAVLHMMHDPALTDNPPSTSNGQRSRSHDFQVNSHNQGHPGIFDFLESLRKVTDEYGAIFTVAEVGGTGQMDFARACAEDGKRLNSAYGFDFLYANELTPELVCKAQASWPDEDGVGWPSWAFENHDAPRAVSRWDHGGHKDAFLRMKMALACMLRGNIILYQGEELGLDQVDIPYELVQDPEALRNWPMTLSRDGARTPMPWKAESECGGFGSHRPWLPMGENHKSLAADRQMDDPNSLLNLTRELIALRSSHPALRYGSLAECDHDDFVLAMTREYEGEKILCLFNMGSKSVDISERSISEKSVLRALNGASAKQLPAFGVLILTA